MAKQPTGPKPTDERIKCGRCCTLKPPHDFYLSRGRQGAGRQGYCNTCRRAYQQEWLVRNRPRKMLQDAKRRAKLKRLPFDLNLEDINIPETCPVLGIPLFSGDGKPCDNSPTLERLVPEKGYVRGNVIVVSAKANRMRNSATAQELLRAGCWYAQNHPQV